MPEVKNRLTETHPASTKKGGEPLSVHPLKMALGALGAHARICVTWSPLAPLLALQASWQLQRLSLPGLFVRRSSAFPKP